MDVDLRHLRAVATLAEELNFTRAAQRLHLDQPSLSRRIKALERHLGVALFTRSTHAVSLTDAGAEFAAHARDALAAAERAVTGARARGHAERLQVRVGAIDWYPYTNVLHDAVRIARAAGPGLDVQIVPEPWVTHPDGVRQGRLDIGFGLSLDPRHHPPELTATRWRDDPAGHALVAEAGALAGRRVLGAEDLAGLPLLLAPRPAHPELHAEVDAALPAAGLTARYGEPITSFAAAVQAVAAGIGWILVVGTVAAFPPPGTTAVRLRGVTVPLGVDVLRRAGRPAPAESAVVKALLRAAPS